MYPDKFGRYEIDRQLGRGGMSVVYLAHDPRVKRNVAVKVMNLALTTDPLYRSRFKREAEIIANLEHPNITPIYDFGEHEEQPYIVMRAIMGGSLATRIQEGPIPIHEAIHILMKIAPALDKAHEKGIIHRDLKPANILFDQEDEPYITDFGIAHLTQAMQDLTSSGAMIGTPAYMSPEQVETLQDIDGRSDLYSLGVILFEMLTGLKPYQADTPIHLAMKHLQEPVPNILEINPSLPPGCEAVIWKALAKKREDRYHTATELAEALVRVYYASADTPIFEYGLPATPIPFSTTEQNLAPGKFTPDPDVPTIMDTPPKGEDTSTNSHTPMPGTFETEQTSPVLPPPAQKRRFSFTWLFALAGVISILLISLSLSGALRRPGVAAISTATPSESATETAAQPLETATVPAAALQSTAESTATVEPSASPTSIIFPELSPITIDNVEEITEIGRLGNGVIRQISVHPDGDKFALAGSLGILIYDLDTFEFLEFLESQTKVINSVAWSPDGRYLASASGDGSVFVRDMELELNLFKFEDLGAPVNIIAWSPDGSQLAAGTSDHAVYIWETLTGRLQKVINEHSSAVSAIAWSPDGNYLATAGWYINIWDNAAWTLAFSVGGHHDAVSDLAWSADSSVLASASKDGTTRIWDLKNNGKSSAVLEDHPGPVLSIARSPDDSLLALASLNQIIVRDTKDYQIKYTIEGHEEAVNNLAWSLDGEYLISTSLDGTLRKWTAQGEQVELVGGYKDDIKLADWSPDGTKIAINSGDLSIHVWDAASGNELFSAAGHLDTINCITWSPDGAYIASGSDDLTTRVWDAETGKQLHLISIQDNIITSLDWSPDGTLLAIGSADGSIVFWDPETGEEVNRVSQQGQLHSIDWNPDSSLLAFANSNEIWVRGTTTGKVNVIFPGHSSQIHQIAWAPDGIIIGSVGEDETIRFWNLDRGLQTRLIYQSGSVESITWSLDGSVCITVGADGSIHFWNGSTGVEVRTITENRDAIHQILLTQDGTRLATVSDDGTFRIWGVPAD